MIPLDIPTALQARQDEKETHEKMSPLPDEFDIIVCGGGSCGCVVAGRYVFIPSIKFSLAH